MNPELSALLDAIPEGLPDGSLKWTADGLELALPLQKESFVTRHPVFWLLGSMALFVVAMVLSAAFLPLSAALIATGMASSSLFLPLLLTRQRQLRLQHGRAQLGDWSGVVSEIEVDFHRDPYPKRSELRLRTAAGTWICAEGITNLEPDVLEWVAKVLEASKRLPESERGTEADRPDALASLRRAYERES